MSDGDSRHHGGTMAAGPAGDRQLAPDRHERQLQQVLTQIEGALHHLRFGQVTITVQDGVVVQIDRLERTRIQRGAD
jgi:hypothetical protein